MPATIPSGRGDAARPDRRPRLRKTSHGTATRPCGRLPAYDDGRHGPRRPRRTCSPPSTTSASPCPTSTRRSRSTATPSAWRPCTRRPTRSRASREAMVAVGDSGSLHPAARPARRDVDDREVPRPHGPGMQQLAYRVTDVEAVSRDPARARRPPAVRRAAARHRGLAGSTSSTPRTPAASSSSWSSPPRPPTERRVETPSHTGRTSRPAPLDATRTAPEPAGDDRAADPRRHPRRRHRPRRTSPPSSCPSPTAPRPSTRTRSTCSRGCRARTRTRASRCTSRTSPLPELGPGEALVAVMASAINYNTVWTSIFEPVSTFGFLERYGRVTPLAKRHDLPYHVVGSDLAGVVLATGAGRAPLEARRRGRRALPVGRAREPRRPQRHDARPRAADLGLRDQLRRPGRDRAGQVQPADAQARATSPGRRPPPPGW